MVKIFPYGGQEQELLVSSAPLQLPKQPLHKPEVAQNSLYISFLCWPVAKSKVEMPFKLLFCKFFKIIWWIVRIRLAMTCYAAQGISLSSIFAPGSGLFGQKSDTNAAILPHSLAWIIAQRLDSKASKSGLLQSIVCVCVQHFLVEFKIQF